MQEHKHGTYCDIMHARGLQSIKNICKKHGIQKHLKSGTTMKNTLVAPKGKDTIIKSGIIYRFICDMVHY